MYSGPQSQVADLDDEFAELLLTDFSDNFHVVPSVKVSNMWDGCIYAYNLGTVTQEQTVSCADVSSAAGGCAPGHSGP